MLTTTWVDLMGDKNLFQLNRLVLARDSKILTCVGLIVGAFTARALLEYISDAGALGVGVGLRVAIAVGFLFVPGPTPLPTITVEKPQGEDAV